jgi:hypothetical protein
MSLVMQLRVMCDEVSWLMFHHFDKLRNGSGMVTRHELV